MEDPGGFFSKPPKFPKKAKAFLIVIGIILVLLEVASVIVKNMEK